MLKKSAAFGGGYKGDHSKFHCNQRNSLEYPPVAQSQEHHKGGGPKREYFPKFSPPPAAKEHLRGGPPKLLFENKLQRGNPLSFFCDGST